MIQKMVIISRNILFLRFIIDNSLLILLQQFHQNISMNFEARYFHRQTEVLNQQTQSKVKRLRVFISKLTLTGLEVAKNLVMMGVKRIGLFDDSIVTESDAKNSFYFSKRNIGTTKAHACEEKLKPLSFNTEIVVSKSNGVEQIANHFDIVVLVDHWDYDYVVSLNNEMRSRQKGFILTGSLGLYGFIFVDFGDNHMIIDPIGQRQQRRHIQRITNENQAHVTIAEEDPSLKTGDFITISHVKGMSEINEKTYKIMEKYGNAYKINADTTYFSTYRSGGIIIEPIQPQHMNFSSLDVCLQTFQKNNEIQQNFGCLVPQQKLTLKQIFILRCFFAFYQKHKRLFDLFNHLQVDVIEQIMKSLQITQKQVQLYIQEIRTISRFASITFGFFSNIMGGMAAQQVIKFTGKYTPINQWMHINQTNLICCPQISQAIADKFEMVFGKQLASKLSNMNVMLIGAGPLGSEFVKIFSQMNIGTEKGKLTIVDDDTVNDYHLNRMCLATKQDLGSSKASLLTAKAHSINQNMKLEAFKARAHKQDQYNKPIPSDVWKSQDLIISAVDSVSQRSFINNYCLKYSKIMLNCGSEDLNFSTEVIIPHKTMNYNDLTDKNTQFRPYPPKHRITFKFTQCIQLMIDKLEDLDSLSSQLKEFSMDKQQFLKKYIKQQKKRYNDQFQYERLAQMLKFVTLSQANSYQLCVEAALVEFYQRFNVYPKKMLLSFPLDTIREYSNQYFWSGFRSPPQEIVFRSQDSIHCEFIYSLSSIYANILRIKQCNQRQTINIAIKILESQHFNEKILSAGSKIQNVSEYNQQILTKLRQSKCVFKQDHAFQRKNPSPNYLSYIYSASCMHAQMYQLKAMPRLETEKIACRSVGTIMPTVSIAAGFLTLQLLKVLKNDQSSCRNTYASFETSVLVQSNLSNPKLNVDKQYDVILCGPIKVVPECFDEWDALKIVGPMTVDELRHHYTNRLKLTVSCIMVINPSIIVYAEYNARGNGKYSGLQLSQCIKLHEANSNAHIEFPIEIYVGGTCINQQADALLPNVHYYLLN